MIRWYIFNAALYNTLYGAPYILTGRYTPILVTRKAISGVWLWQGSNAKPLTALLILYLVCTPLVSTPTSSFQPTLKTFTPRPAAAGASMNLIWHLGQQPEAGYSAKRVRASASVALHVKKR